MGWTNFIIVPKLKFAIEVNRSINTDDCDSDFETFEEFVEETEKFDDEIEYKNYKELNLKDLASLIKVSENIHIFNEIYNELFIWWLKLRGFEFEIMHEDDFNKGNYKEKGFTIIKM